PGLAIEPRVPQKRTRITQVSRGAGPASKKDRPREWSALVYDETFLLASHSAALITSCGCRFLRAAFRSSSFCSTAKNDGTKRTARQVEAMMPLRTLTPREIRLTAPAPVAVTSGTTPRPNANDVIKIGRNRRRDASIAASRIGLPWTIR